MADDSEAVIPAKFTEKGSATQSNKVLEDVLARLNHHFYNNSFRNGRSCRSYKLELKSISYFQALDYLGNRHPEI